MRIGHLCGVGLVTLSLASIPGCGAPAPELARGLSERALARLAQAPPLYAPPAGAAAGETAAMAAAFEAALEPQARVRVRHDPALDLVAAALAENFSDQGQRTSAALAQWLLWKSGSVAMYRDHSGGFSSSSGRSGTRPMPAEWTARAASWLNASPGSTLSYGLYRFSAGRVTAETFVFGAAPFDVATFSKTYAPGAPLTLSLRPRIPFRELRVSMDVGDAVEEETLAPRADGSFFFARNVPARPGRYFVEVQGLPPLRLTQMTLPIYVGVPEPAAPDGFLQSPPAGPADPSGWPAWLARTYDAERARLGKPPVEVDPRLSALAAERSLVVAAGRRVPPPDADSFAARLTATGLSPAAFSETVTTASATDALLLNLLRPSVRKRLVLSQRVLFGAAAAPRPLTGNHPQSFSIVEETVIPAGEAPAPAGPPPAAAPPAAAPPAPSPPPG